MSGLPAAIAPALSTSSRTARVDQCEAKALIATAVPSPTAPATRSSQRRRWTTSFTSWSGSATRTSPAPPRYGTAT
ncbi:MAG: hypothetical protein IPK07_02115 [Deltaproteobacteria bacterium]|nr:hypothetical protein [Deltaproteobacteria bacterium]